MSQKESWRTRKYWSRTGGILIEEFLAVKGSKTTGKRLIDGVIVISEESRIYDGNFYNIEGNDVIIIQTKCNRIGMYLLGQAFFSKFLVEKYNPRSIKSVAICGAYDDIIGELAKDHDVDVVVIEDKEYEEKFDNPKYREKNKIYYNKS